MIQRIQSLYLVVVAIACSLLFFFPMIDFIDPGKGTYKLFAIGMKSWGAQPMYSWFAVFLANFPPAFTRCHFTWIGYHDRLSIQKPQNPI